MAAAGLLVLLSAMSLKLLSLGSLAIGNRSFLSPLGSPLVAASDAGVLHTNKNLDK